MQYTIRSDQLEVTVNALGAEMVSIRGADGTDYLCPESRRNWYASAPVLFPNTGAVKDQYALVEGKRYPFRQHGFARDSMFSPVSAERAKWRLNSGGQRRRCRYTLTGLCFGSPTVWKGTR